MPRLAHKRMHRDPRFTRVLCCAAMLCSLALGPVVAHAAVRPRTAAPTGDAAETAIGHGAIAASLPVPVIDAAEVHAGETVTLRWRSLEGVAEELELVFSLDDGRTFDVRVSPELSGGESHYHWRVPNVGVQHAHMRLRARVDGVELSGPASTPFRIVANPVRAPGLWVYRHGEWWEDRGGTPFDMPGLVTPPRSPSLAAEPAGQALAVTVRISVPALHAGPSSPAYAVAVAAPERPAPPSTTLQAFHPMRE
jgi:hypothetical protein